LSRGFFFLWRKCVGGTHVYSSCASCGFYIISINFFSPFGCLLRELGRSLMDAQPCCTTTILTHARALSFPSFTAFLLPPFPLMNNFSSISSLSLQTATINQSLSSHISSHTHCTFTLTPGVGHRSVTACVVFTFFLSLLPCHLTGAFFKPLGTTICPLCSTSLLRCPHHNPTRFFRKFHTHIQFPHFSPTPRLYHQLKRNPLSHRSRA
jgi:hypothetical protein